MRTFRRIVGPIILLFLIVGGFLAYASRQNIYDWTRLYNYQPSSPISQLATDDTMTALGRHIFYVNHPDLTADKTYFNQQCGAKEQAIVLGCYHSEQLGIFLYEVDDPALHGVEQVTAAHEMLHGAYDRLSAGDRDQVDSLLMDYYQHDLHDPRVIDEINLYKKTEPKDIVNEMHSVFGTEIANLPGPLENYYKRYFTDRQKIAQYAANYQGAFTNRENQVSADDAQLTIMKKQIATQQTDLQTKQQALATQRTQMDTDRANGDVNAYNTLVNPYNSAVDAYNSEVAALKTLIAQYNALVDTRNGIAVQENQLTQEINSQAAAVPSE